MLDETDAAVSRVTGEHQGQKPPAVKSMLELAEWLRHEKVDVRGQSFDVRAITDFEHASLARLFPAPLAPLNMQDPSRGSLAPKIENYGDEEFRRARSDWGRARVLREIVIAAELVELTGADENDRNAVAAAAQKLGKALTPGEVGRVWEVIQDLSSDAASAKAVGALVVDTTNIPFDAMIEPPSLPENYGTTQIKRDLEICERFGILPWEFANADPGWKALLRGNESVRRAEEARIAGKH